MPSSFNAERYRYACCQCVFFFLCAAKTHAATVQEFRQELQAAETKDKKFTKRKTVLKKIVANITMGNDSPYCQRLLARSCSWKSAFIVSALFVDVVQCLGTPLLEIKKSASALSILVSI